MVDARRLRAVLLPAVLMIGVWSNTLWAARDGQTVSEAFPNLSSGALASAKLAALPKGVVLRSGKLVLKQTDLDAAIRKSSKDI